jgi:hypothetical protein
MGSPRSMVYCRVMQTASKAYLCLSTLCQNNPWGSGRIWAGCWTAPVRSGRAIWSWQIPCSSIPVLIRQLCIWTVMSSINHTSPSTRPNGLTHTILSKSTIIHFWRSYKLITDQSIQCINKANVLQDYKTETLNQYCQLNWPSKNIHLYNHSFISCAVHKRLQPHRTSVTICRRQKSAKVVNVVNDDNPIATIRSGRFWWQLAVVDGDKFRRGGSMVTNFAVADGILCQTLIGMKLSLLVLLIDIQISVVWILRASLNQKAYIRIMVGPSTADSHFYLNLSVPLFLQKVGNSLIAKRGVGATFSDFDKLHDHPIKIEQTKTNTLKICSEGGSLGPAPTISTGQKNQ